jgi:hypothetical protein
MLQRLCGIEQVMAQRLRDAGWRISSGSHASTRRTSVGALATDVRAVRFTSLLGDAQLTSTDGQSDRHRRSSGKLCELRAVSPWSRLRPRRKSVRLNRSRDECTVNRPSCGTGLSQNGNRHRYSRPHAQSAREAASHQASKTPKEPLINLAQLRLPSEPRTRGVPGESPEPRCQAGCRASAVCKGPPTGRICCPSRPPAQKMRARPTACFAAARTPPENDGSSRF